MHSIDRRRPRSGLTLIELMITVTIGAILLALAVPQMREYIARKRVSGTATELAGDIRLARSMVQQQNQPIWINFGSTSDFTCYVLYTEGAGADICDCTRTSTPMCTVTPGGGADDSIALRSVIIQRNTGIAVTATAPNLRYTQPVGAPRVYGGASAEAEVSGGSLGGSVKLILSGLTRATICSLSGHTAEFGDCP